MYAKVGSETREVDTNPVSNTQLYWGSGSRQFPLPVILRGVFPLFGWTDFVWKVKVYYIKWFVLKEKLTQPDGEQIIQFKKINSVREKWQIYDSI